MRLLPGGGVHSHIDGRYPMRALDYELHCSPLGEVSCSQGMRILVMYAIPAKLAFPLGVYGAYGGFEDGHESIDALLSCQPADAGQ